MLHFQRTSQIESALDKDNSWRPACKKKSVRIAILRSTNTTSTSPLQKENERAETSFRDVLASRASGSTQPAKSPSAAATPGIASQTNSEGTDRNEQSVDAATPKDQPYGQNENRQPAAVSINQKPAAPQALPSQWPTRSTSGTANSATNRDERPQMSATALAAKIAATVVLPAASPVATAVAIPVLPAQPLADEETGEQARESNDGACETPVDAIADRGPSAARSENRGDDKPQAPAAKVADGTSENGTDASSENQEAPSSTPAGIADFKLPANQCGDISSLNGSTLTGISLMPGMADALQWALKDAQSSKTPDQPIGKATDAAVAGGSGKNNQANGSPASADSSLRSIPNSDQTTQHAQPGASQVAVAAPKAADGAAPQIQVLAAQPAPHESPASHIRTDSPAEAARPNNLPAEPQTADTAATSGINTARLIQNMGETEMRVGMRSAEFGDISIRTAVSQQQMMAQISVDHSDLGKAISAHIPAMQEKLGGELGLRAMVEVSQSGMSFSSERGYSSQQQPKTYSLPAVSESIQPSAEADPALLRTTTSEPGNSYRLDIRA